MQNDAPSRRGGVTEPNEFDEIQRRRHEYQARLERRRRIAIRIIDALIALTLAAIVAIVLHMIFF
jgi:type IV secretory pathway component VirB8